MGEQSEDDGPDEERTNRSENYLQLALEHDETTYYVVHGTDYRTSTALITVQTYDRLSPLAHLQSLELINETKVL